MKRTNPLPRFDVDEAFRRIMRHGPKARAHLAALVRPVRVTDYKVDYTVRRLVYRKLVLVIPYLGVDMLVNAAAVNVALGVMAQ